MVADTAPQFTRDAYYGGLLSLWQPAAGARAGSDALFLAAAVPAQAGEQVLELGSGIGSASLALARRVSGLEMRGVEIEADLIVLAERNAHENNLSGQVSFFSMDLEAQGTAEAIVSQFGRFDHVMANPPFFDRARSSEPKGRYRARARRASSESLDRWLEVAGQVCRMGGSVTVIWRQDRVDELEKAVSRDFGKISILPLVARSGQPAKRILLQAWKGAAFSYQRLPDLVLHGTDGRYLPAIDCLLRQPIALTLTLPSDPSFRS